MPSAPPFNAVSGSRLVPTSNALLDAPATLPLVMAFAWLVPAGPFTAVAVVLVAALLALSPPQINSAALRLALPFLLMAAWATMMGFGHDRYDFLKDLWYALKLALCLMIGFMLGVRVTDARASLAGFVWFATASACWSIVTWRRSAGDGLDTIGLEGFEHLSLSSVAALPILYYGIVRDRGFRQVVAAMLAMVIGFAVVLSASRTTIVSAGIMMLAALGLFSTWRRLVVVALLIAVGMYLTYLLVPEYHINDLSLAAKFRHSLDEILLTDSTDPQQMFRNWRGFEAYNAQLLFDSSSFLRRLFGNGFGTSVDLGMEIYGDDGSITRFQPILHNGYYYILVKYGVSGIFAYAGTLLWYTFAGRRSGDFRTLEDRLLLGLVGSVLFATLVVTGLYNKGALQDISILLAWLVGQGCRYRRDHWLPMLPSATPSQPATQPA